MSQNFSIWSNHHPPFYQFFWFTKRVPKLLVSYGTPSCPRIILCWHFLMSKKGGGSIALSEVLFKNKMAHKCKMSLLHSLMVTILGSHSHRWDNNLDHASHFSIKCFYEIFSIKYHSIEVMFNSTLINLFDQSLLALFRYHFLKTSRRMLRDKGSRVIIFMTL